MSKHHNLEAQQRVRSGSSEIKRMRREGFIPAVIYGAGQDNVNLKIKATGLRDILANSASDNILIDLAIEKESDTRLALIQDIQHDHLQGGILHVDFHAVREDQHITASVPLELIGTALGVKNGGIMDQLVYNLDVRCFPKDLPETIQIDINELDIGSSVHVGEVDLGEGLEFILDDDVVVLQVSETRAAMSEGDGEGEEEGEAAESAEGAEGGDADGGDSAEGGDS